MSQATRKRSNGVLTRRQFMAVSGLALAGGLIGPARVLAAPPVLEIHMKSKNLGERVYFDPIGVLVEPGTKIRWIVDADVHTATAYHPSNDDHPLRIPTAAEPWDSDYLVNPGDSFEVTLSAEGVYDYFCAPHELAGMVGRIIVGRPGGPGARPFDYHTGQPGTSSWSEVPPAAQKAFPSIAEIMKRRTVSHA